MLTRLIKTIEVFSEKYPKWDEVIANFFNSDNDEVSSHDQAVMDEFSDILMETVNIAKNNNIEIQELASIFGDFVCWPFIEKFIAVKLGSFYEYLPLRKIANEDSYKAKYCIDLIWSSYIVRFDSHMVFDDRIPMSEDDFKGVAVQLDRFTDRCISRQLHRSSVIIELQEDSNLPQTLCEYVADKFETDYHQIRLNYIIYRLSSCEKAIKELRDSLPQ